MKTNIGLLSAAIGCALFTGACTQTTPSMMNTSMVELNTETHVEQIPGDMINETTLSILAHQYTKHGDGPLELTMTYDPASKVHTAKKSLLKLKEVEKMLAKKGLGNIKTDALPLEGLEPVLMVMYPSVQAQAPSDCGAMPGLFNNKTDRFIDNYKFGCGTETLLAKQISRPADLRGRGGDVVGPADGRRITSVLETYHTLNEQQASGALQEGLERENLISE